MAGQWDKVLGEVPAEAQIALADLVGRVPIESLIAHLELTPGMPTTASSDDCLPIYLALSDEGFTFAVARVIAPLCHASLVKWEEVLSPQEVRVGRRTTCYGGGGGRPEGLV